MYGPQKRKGLPTELTICIKSLGKYNKHHNNIITRLRIPYLRIHF